MIAIIESIGRSLICIKHELRSMRKKLFEVKKRTLILVIFLIGNDQNLIVLEAI